MNQSITGAWLMNIKSVENRRSLFSWSVVAGLGFTVIIFYWMYVIWNISVDLYGQLSIVTAQHNEIPSLEVEMKGEIQEWENLLLRSDNLDSLGKNWITFEAQHLKVSRVASNIIRQYDGPTIKREMNAFVGIHTAALAQYRNGMELLIKSNFDSHQADAATKGIERPLFDHLAVADSAMREENKRISESLRAKAQDKIEQSLFVLGFVAILAVWIPR
jgi:hypothetical protein